MKDCSLMNNLVLAAVRGALLLIFTSGLIDIPLPARPVSKCCCSNEIFCQCHHLDGNCSRQKKSQRQVNGIPASRALSLIPVGCGEDGTKSAVFSVSAKDFYIENNSAFFLDPAARPFFEPSGGNLFFLTDARIDRPPRFF